VCGALCAPGCHDRRPSPKGPKPPRLAPLAVSRGARQWHAKSPAQGKCPAILPHKCTNVRNQADETLPTGFFIDEAGEAPHNYAPFARYPQGHFAPRRYPQPTPGD